MFAGLRRHANKEREFLAEKSGITTARTPKK
jgi:hypothetical protein